MSESLINSNIERTARQLSNAEVQRQLGGVASTLLSLNESLYVPTRNADGTLVFENEGTPILALSSGESIEMTGDAASFSDAQRDALIQKGIPVSEIDRVESSLVGKTFTMPDFAQGSVVRTTGTSEVRLRSGDKARMTINGRPVVALNSSQQIVHKANLVLPHELVHVYQDTQRPFKLKTPYGMVQREAEAYSIGGKVEAALQQDKGSEPRATKSYRVMREYEDYKKAGGDLKTADSQRAFEQKLRDKGIGILSPHVEL